MEEEDQVTYLQNVARNCRGLAGVLVLVMAVAVISCSRGEAPAVAEEQAAEQGQEAAGADASGAVAPNAAAPGTRPSAGGAGQTASRSAAAPASRPAASTSTASGWGDQATQPARTAPAAPVARTYTLPAGSSLRVRTTSTMSTKNLETGATFNGSLAEAIEVDGKTIAERGANVVGRVVNSDPGGRVKGRAMLQVAVTQLQLANGEMADVSTSAFEQVAESSTKRDAAKVAIGSGVGAAIGAIAGGGKGAAIGAGVGAGAGTGAVLATRGSDAVIPAETLITFSTQSPVSVKLP